ncbi:MAG TPA: hypothetical protein VGL19_09485, partial [Polyangiaceae bacterium]
MSEQDQPQRGTSKSGADQTLLGVAPPRVDSSADSPQRSPVFVRSGTSVADVEPALAPRVPPPSAPAPSGPVSDAPVSIGASDSAGLRSRFEPVLRYAGARPVLWMAVIPVLFSLSLVAATGHRRSHALPPVVANSAVAATAPAAGNLASEPSKTNTLAELESRPASSLRSRELVLLAEARAEQKRSVASALREKLESDPSSGKDSALQGQLLRLAEDPATAAEALSSMALLPQPTGADLLYEVWTGTPVRSDTTELARSLLYSPDVRPKASPALAVSLDLRVAETCEQYAAALPKALTDGDRRALHLLLKLNVKRGCGPKKTEDCYACLRDKKDELT